MGDRGDNVDDDDSTSYQYEPDEFDVESTRENTLEVHYIDNPGLATNIALGSPSIPNDPTTPMIVSPRERKVFTESAPATADDAPDAQRTDAAPDVTAAADTTQTTANDEPDTQRTDITDITAAATTGSTSDRIKIFHYVKEFSSFRKFKDLAEAEVDAILTQEKIKNHKVNPYYLCWMKMGDGFYGSIRFLLSASSPHYHHPVGISSKGFFWNDGYHTKLSDVIKGFKELHSGKQRKSAKSQKDVSLPLNGPEPLKSWQQLKQEMNPGYKIAVWNKDQDQDEDEPTYWTGKVEKIVGNTNRPFLVQYDNGISQRLLETYERVKVLILSTGLTTTTTTTAATTTTATINAINDIPRGLPNRGNTCFCNSLLQVLACSANDWVEKCEQQQNNGGRWPWYEMLETSDDKKEAEEYKPTELPRRDLVNSLVNVISKMNRPNNSLTCSVDIDSVEELRRSTDNDNLFPSGLNNEHKLLSEGSRKQHDVKEFYDNLLEILSTSPISLDKYVTIELKRTNRCTAEGCEPPPGEDEVREIFSHSRSFDLVKNKEDSFEESVADCINCSLQPFTGDCRCQYCGKEDTTEVQYHFKKLPPVLVLVAKRANQCGKAENYRVSKCLDPIFPNKRINLVDEDGPATYHRAGIIDHTGKKYKGGHYVSDVKRGKFFYKTNDNHPIEKIGNPDHHFRSNASKHYVFVYKRDAEGEEEEAEAEEEEVAENNKDDGLVSLLSSNSSKASKDDYQPEGDSRITVPPDAITLGPSRRQPKRTAATKGRKKRRSQESQQEAACKKRRKKVTLHELLSSVPENSDLSNAKRFSSDTLAKIIEQLTNKEDAKKTFLTLLHCIMKDCGFPIEHFEGHQKPEGYVQCIGVKTVAGMYVTDGGYSRLCIRKLLEVFLEMTRKKALEKLFKPNAQTVLWEYLFEFSEPASQHYVDLHKLSNMCCRLEVEDFTPEVMKLLWRCSIFTCHLCGNAACIQFFHHYFGNGITNRRDMIPQAMANHAETPEQMQFVHDVWADERDTTNENLKMKSQEDVFPEGGCAFSKAKRGCSNWDDATRDVYLHFSDKMQQEHSLFPTAQKKLSLLSGSKRKAIKEATREMFIKKRVKYVIRRKTRGFDKTMVRIVDGKDEFCRYCDRYGKDNADVDPKACEGRTNLKNCRHFNSSGGQKGGTKGFKKTSKAKEKIVPGDAPFIDRGTNLSATDLWNEYKHGVDGRESLESLEDKHGSEWRSPLRYKETIYQNRKHWQCMWANQKCFYDYIKALTKDGTFTESEALAFAQQLINERAGNKPKLTTVLSKLRFRFKEVQKDIDAKKANGAMEPESTQGPPPLSRAQRSYEMRITELEEYKNTNGHTNVTAKENNNLERFCRELKDHVNKGRLTSAQLERVRKLGMRGVDKVVMDVEEATNF